MILKNPVHPLLDTPKIEKRSQIYPKNNGINYLTLRSYLV